MVRFNSRSRLDASQVRDTRGSRVSGRTAAIGGGGLGIIGLLVVVALQLFGGGTTPGGAGGLLAELGGAGSPATADNDALAESCRTGADAEQNRDCALVAVINSVQDYWAAALPQEYRETETVFFAGAVNTGCGQADSAIGPFYCPADRLVYIDLSFFDTLVSRFGANDALFTQAYVLAHEYGHHVQNLLGTNDSVGTATGPESGSVRLELQADCYAGLWAAHATSVPGEDGTVLISDITEADVAAALDTAGRIGDDYIQTHLGGGQVDESAFSHGSTEQRRHWLERGLAGGDPTNCDTFGADVDLG